MQNTGSYPLFIGDDVYRNIKKIKDLDYYKKQDGISRLLRSNTREVILEAIRNAGLEYKFEGILDKLAPRTHYGGSRRKFRIRTRRLKHTK